MSSVEKFARSILRRDVSPEEWDTRIQLAAAYRLVYLNRWDDLIFTHISARLPNTDDEFLINPFGLGFDEICASNLVRIDSEGNVLDGSPYPVNRAGFLIHHAIHEARKDAACVIHLHTDFGIAVSMLKNGLIPASQTAMVVNLDLAYHDYEGIVTRDDEKERLIESIGTKNSVILRNHGTLALGKSVGDAFERIYRLEKACKYQILAQSTGQEFAVPRADAMQNVVAGIKSVSRDLVPGTRPWDALRRRLDRQDLSYQL